MLRKGILLIVMILLLAACGDNDDPLPPAQPRTTPLATSALPPAPLPTKLVTRTPSPEPTFTPSPTPNMTLAAIEGEWAFMMRVEVLDTALVDEILYSALASVTVHLDGSVTGEGVFSPTLAEGDCPVTLEDYPPLSFQLQGALRSNSFVLDLTLLPQDAALLERYTVICYDAAGNATPTPIEQAVLWPLLQSAEMLTFQFDLAQFNNRITQEYDLSTLTNNQWVGLLRVEAYLGR